MIECLDHASGENWTLFNGDCVEVMRQLPDASIGMSIFSPPFAQLFIYSESERDMGNCNDEAHFFECYRHVASELYRLTKPGRICVVHCTDLPRTKSVHGHVGLYDFPADLRKAHEDAGWIYHSRVTVWKDPVVEMQRTKALGLLYKQLCKDSTRSRMGMPDYLMVFRKDILDETQSEPVGKDRANFPVDQWQKWASPVWMDIQQTKVLNNYRDGKDPEDEKHICPLQLDLIERCVRMWSNPGDVVLSPFAGIGSEGYEAVKAGRKFIGTELKTGYFKTAIKNLRDAELTGSSPLLDMAGAADD
jgi:DNA modification methylase